MRAWIKDILTHKHTRDLPRRTQLILLGLILFSFCLLATVIGVTASDTKDNSAFIPAPTTSPSNIVPTSNPTTSKIVPTSKPTAKRTTIKPSVARTTSKPKPQCDPNYAGGCVPIASDVDCAGGSGNGPRYFSGTARVVGRDIYDLDRDNDGIACN